MSSQKDCLLGIDVGTTGCKAEILDVEGRSLGQGYLEYPLIHPKPGWVETDPDGHWWNALCQSTREALSRANVEPERIAAVSISCTNGLVAVDKSGRPLRNAIMQMDKRTIPQAERINNELGRELVELSGNRAGASGTSAPIMLWLKENEPEVFDATHKFLWPGGYMVYKLTGEYTMEWSRASWTNLFDVKKTQTWSESICDKLGIPLQKLPRLVPPWEVVGEVLPSAAEETGLAPGTPVVGGMADTPAAGLGTRATAPGRTCHIIGTTARPCVVLDRPVFDSRFVNCCHAVPGTWFSLGAIENAGLTLRWFRDVFGQLEIAAGQVTGGNPFDFLDMEASRSVPGARGLLFLPYLAGERSPIWDPNARAVFFGLSVSHKREDIVRAVMEGVAFAFLSNLVIFEKELGVTMNEVFLSGGGSKSSVWPQIHADVSGKVIKTVKVKNSEAIGNAILAGYAVGIYKDISSAADEIVQIDKVFEPDPRAHAVYLQAFDLYRQIYAATKELFPKLGVLRG